MALFSTFLLSNIDSSLLFHYRFLIMPIAKRKTLEIENLRKIFYGEGLSNRYMGGRGSFASLTYNFLSKPCRTKIQKCLFGVVVLILKFFLIIMWGNLTSKS